MAAAKTKRPASTNPYVRLATELGLPRLDAFRRADLTGKLREKAGLTEEHEHRLTAIAELSRLGLPAQAAEALALSGALGSAGELAALTVEEAERLFQENRVKRLLPSAFKVDRVEIESWLRLATPLTTDEAAPGRSAVSEMEEAASSSDEDVSVAAEELMLTRAQVVELLSALKQSWSRTEATLAQLGRTAPIDGAVLRASVRELHDGIGAVIGRLGASAPGEFAAIDEEAPGLAADEESDAARELVRLQGELKRIELMMAALQTAIAGGSEAESPAAASEDAEESQTATRGE
jgi:hypothetical protein